MLSRGPGRALSLHLPAVVFCSLLVILAARGARQQASLLSDAGTTAEIAVEHRSTATLRIDSTSLKGVGMLDMANESTESIAVSLPTVWIRREVRGAPLSSFTSEPSALSFTRWTFPPKAEATFALPVMPDHLVLLNPTAIPLQITLTQVNMYTGESDHSVILVQGEPAKLW
ncbi:MAG: hypothetical protein V1926_02280 [Candidatus Peregrinibacteria bacterium]